MKTPPNPPPPLVLLLLLHVALLAVVIRLQLTTTLAFSPPRRLLIKHHTSRRQNRYFTQESLLPPLQRVVGTNVVHTSRHCSNNTMTSSSFSSSSSSSSTTTDDYTRSIPVMYTNDPASVARWLEQNVPSHGCTLGFDVESVPRAPWIRPSFLGPAVVQLATPHAALVVQLAKPTKRSRGALGGGGNNNSNSSRGSSKPSRACAPILASVMADAAIIKAGCSIDQDMMELYLYTNHQTTSSSSSSWLGILPRRNSNQESLWMQESTLDLQSFSVNRKRPKQQTRLQHDATLPSFSSSNSILDGGQQGLIYEARSRLDLGGIRLVNAAGNSNNNNDNNTVGLKTLAAEILGVQLVKSTRLAASDWSRLPLTPAQIAYSARDAWTSAAIVAELASRSSSSSWLDLCRSTSTGGGGAAKKQERPIQELVQRQSKRKRAQRLLKHLVFLQTRRRRRQEQKATAAINDDDGSSSVEESLPPLFQTGSWRCRVLQNLKTVVRENQWDAPEIVNVPTTSTTTLIAQSFSKREE